MTHGRKYDLTGKQAGKLTILYPTRNEKGTCGWWCRCSCGNELFVTTGSLVKTLSGSKYGTTSCGCNHGNPVDLTGKRFNHLTAIKRIGIYNDGNPKWLCKCDCGNLHEVSARNLMHGYVKSCGCMSHVGSAIAHTTHGKSKTRLYNVWCAMRRRCNDPNVKCYKNYGGRGIRVCDLWQSNYKAFELWAMSHGYDENASYGECTLDRIDVNGNYEPNNCRWVDMKTQCNNTRKQIMNKG